MRPGTDEGHGTLTSVILGVDIEESLNGDLAAGGVLLDGADVVDPETITIVRLVSKAVDDVQVVVNTLLVGGEEVTGVLGVLEIRKVSDVGNGSARRSRAGLVLLVEFVVEQDVLVPITLGPPTLVGVRSTGVGELGENLGGRLAIFGSGVVDGNGVLIVANADVAATVAAVGAVVGNTLSVVDVAVLASTAGSGGLARVLEVDVLQTSGASLVAGLSTNGNGVLVIPVDDDVMGATNR